MAIDISQMTINTEEKQGISNAIYEQVFVKGDLASNHAIIEGIKHKTQIPFAGQMSMVGKKISGCKTASDGSVTFSEKVWSPELIGFRMEHCATELELDFKLFNRQSKALDWFDESTDEVMGYLTLRGAEAVEEYVNRFTWFGDVDAAVVTSGGTLTDGTDPAYFNAIDGIWKQIFDDVTAGKSKVDIAENTGATHAAQLDLASDTALLTMRKLFEAIDPRARRTGELKYYVSDSLALNFYSYVEDKQAGFSLTYLEDGKEQFSYRGIPVVVMSEWDRIIQTYEDDGTVYNLPNRALLTTPSNIPVGTLDEGSLSEVKSFYDEYNEINVVKNSVIMDAKILEGYMYAVAY